MAEDIVRKLVAEMRLESSKFRKDMDQAAQYAKGSADRIAADFSSKMTTGTVKGMIGLKFGLKTIGASGKDAFNLIGGTASRVFKSIGSEISATARRLKTLTVGAIVAAPVGGAYFLNKIVQDIDNLADNAQRLRLSVNDIQKFSYAFKGVGISTADSLSMFEQVNKRMLEFQTGTGRVSAMFRKLGIDAKEFIGLSPEQVFEKLNILTKDMSNGARVAIFEKMATGASKLIPELEKGSDHLAKMNKEFSDLGLGLDASQLANAGKFADEMDRLGKIWESFKQQTAANLAGPLSEVVKQITQNIKDAGGIRQAANNIAQSILGGIKTFIGIIKTLMASMKELSNIIKGGVDQGNGSSFKDKLSSLLFNPVTFAKAIGSTISGIYNSGGKGKQAFNSSDPFTKGIENFQNKLNINNLILSTIEPLEQLKTGFENVGMGAIKTADALNSTAVPAFERLGNKIADSAIKAADQVANAWQKRMDFISNYEDKFATDRNLPQAESEDFNEEVRELLKFAKGGGSSEGIKSRLKSLEYTKFVEDIDDSGWINGQYQQTKSTSGMQRTIDDLRKNLLGEEKNSILVDVKASPELEAKIIKIAENSFTSILTREAVSTNR